MTKNKILKWATLKVTNVLEGHLFKYQKIHAKSELSGKNGEFDLLHFYDWVNVIAKTKQGHFVFVEQYRIGVDEVTFEIPGGAIYPGEQSEAAAIRELLEETGYKGTNVTLIGKVAPNPAFQRNYAYTYLIEDCEKVQELQLDPLEEIAVHEFTLDEVKTMISDGTINHSLVVAAFCYYFNFEY